MNLLNLIKDIVDNWRGIPDESIFINAATGKEHCEASGNMARATRLGADSALPSLEPITKAIQRIHHRSGDRKFVFIDTPGLDLEEFIPAKAALKMPNGKLVDGIIYLHRVNAPRVTTSPQTYEKVFQGLLGNEWEKKTLFATTMWNGVDNAKGEDRQQKLETYWQQARQRGAKERQTLVDFNRSSRIVRLLSDFLSLRRDGQALGSTAGIVLPSESAKGYTKPTANDARSSLVPDSHDQRSRDRKRSRDDLQTREAGVRRSTPTYTAEHTSIQDDPSPEIIYNTGELAQLGGTDVSSLQEIPDEDDSQAPEGADQDASDTLSHIGLQVDDKPHNLRKPDHAMSHTEVDPDVYLPENDNVLGRGDRSFTDKGLKIAAYSPPDVVVDGPKPQIREVRDSAESSGFSENGSCLNANLQNKSNIQHPHEHVDVGNASVAMNPSEATPLRDSDVDGLSPTERPAATVNDGNKKGFSRFMNLRNKQKEVAAYMKKAGKIFKVKTEDLKEDDIIIAIMGPTGAGKSSFINMATGNATGVGHDLESCTNSIDILKFQCIERSMQDIIFVDTPGFDDTHKSDVEILEMIAGWLKQTYEQNVKLAGILYFHRITDNRMAGTPLKNLHMFEKLCGKDALQNIILTTTMWDEVDEPTGEQREKELERHYWKTMISQGSKTMRYQNTDKSAWNIIDSIVVGHNERYAVELQKELVDLEKELPETGAGKELFSKLQALVKRQQDTLHRLRESMKRHDDETILNALKEEYEELRLQTEATVKEMEVLKIPIGKRLRRLFTSTLGFFKLFKK
ncbi:hypothetical protein EYR40_002590 [Pleurotus pulmonarius]|nr:hypothetical protein EYR40_002590 [Pleurotus pulmonarius]